MAPSNSKGKAKSSIPKRFEDYLNGLQKEFESQSNPTSAASRSSRYNIFLGGLKGEFELMVLEIESLQKERDESNAKVEALTKELQDIRRNVVCERCRKETKSSIQKRASPAPSPRLVIPSKAVPKRTSPSPSPRPVVQSKAVHKPSSSSRVVKPFQQAHPARATTTASPSPSQSRSSQRSPVLIVSPSPSTSTSSETSTSSVDLAPDTRQRGWSITFPDQVKKELDVEMMHLLHHKNAIFGVKFSHDGKYLSAGCGDGKIYIYNVRTGSSICVLKNLLVARDLVTKVCFSHDGTRLATGGLDGHIYVWGFRKKHVRSAFKGHTKWIHSIDFSPNDRLIVSTSDDNTVRLWNVRDGIVKFLPEDNPLLVDQPHYRSALFSPDGNFVAASHRDGTVRIWGVRTTQLVRRMKAHMDWVNDIAFMPDGKGLVSGRRDKTLKYWDISSLDPIRFLAANDLQGYDSDPEDHTRPERDAPGRETAVLSVATSPDGRWIASGMKNNIQIWDIRNMTVQCLIETPARVDAVDFSPTGRYFACGGIDFKVRIWRY